MSNRWRSRRTKSHAPSPADVVKVRPVDLSDKAEWLRMRAGLWPESREKHEPEIDEFFSSAMHASNVLVAERGDGRLGGFLEVGTRSYADGCSSSPVAYLEGWWVDPDLRRTGVGRRLVSAAEAWARSRGLIEIASDALIENAQGQAAHAALGYQEMERHVCYRKDLTGSA